MSRVKVKLALVCALLVPAAVASAPASERAAPDLCAVTSIGDVSAPRIAVLSAFPAELAPLVAAAEIDGTVDVAGRQYYTGQLDGVRVVLGLLGIGMVNARTIAESVVATFDPAAIIVSGVAGSSHYIGDVVLAVRWIERDRRRVLRANRTLLALAERGAQALPVPFQQCTPVPPTNPSAPIVCLPHPAEVVFEHGGESGDDFTVPFPCTPGAGEIFGCELPVAMALEPSALIAPDVVDMESAAVARIAAENRVPFLAVRGVSDGAGDPLGDRGFPAQFFDYYRLAAFNAAVVTRSVVGELATLAQSASGTELCHLLSRHRWRRAALAVQVAP